MHGLESGAVAGSPAFAEVGSRFARHLTGEVAPNAGVPPLLCGYNAVVRVRVRVRLRLRHRLRLRLRVRVRII